MSKGIGNTRSMKTQRYSPVSRSVWEGVNTSGQRRLTDEEQRKHERSVRLRICDSGEDISAITPGPSEVPGR